MLLDPETGKTEKLDLPATSGCWTREDGKTFLVQAYDAAAKKMRTRHGQARRQGRDVLCDLRDRGYRPTGARFSPDGKRVLFIDADPDRKDAHKWG